MTEHPRGPWPETFPADYRDLYIDRKLGSIRVASLLAAKYSRSLSPMTVLSWARKLDLPVREKTIGKASARGVIPSVTVADVASAEKAGEIVRSPARQEAPLDVPFGFRPIEAPSPEAGPTPAVGEFTFADLGATSCRWCVSPDKAAPTAFRFCGAQAIPGKPYCEGHQARAYTPAKPLRV